MRHIMNNALQSCFSTLGKTAIIFLLFWAMVTIAEAASLTISPNTGVYTANSTFTVRVVVNTDGKPINAADGTLSFNPRELSVVAVNRTNSIFNLWVAEPAFSNSAGTISFSGGSPSGYTGQSGTIMNVTFRALGSGTPRVSYTSGSVLANDGRGTNVLTTMNGGSYTIQAPTTSPEPERIEYVAPANTPAAPQITSSTHADQAGWYTAKDAVLSWTLPSGITGVRTLLDQNPSSVPTKVYDDPIRTITLADLTEGVSYFHLQFRNAEGWGRVAHYRLAVDSKSPTSIAITQAPDNDFSSPIQTLQVAVEDETSAVRRFKIKIDANEPYEFIDETASGTIALPPLDPGYHIVIVEAFDQAGNSIIGTYSFTIEAFDRPRFIEYPTEISEDVIPVIKGMTRPNATVEIFLSRVGGDPTTYSVVADDSGEFIFIPEGRFATGVYQLSARSTDTHGAKSELSDTIRIAVQQPGFLRIGSLLVSVLSVVVPLVAMLILMVLGVWFLLLYLRRFRRQVRTESTEALDMLRQEFSSLQTVLRQHEQNMIESRKTKKLTKAESTMIEALGGALRSSQEKVEKEIADITELTSKESSIR
jgi:hypothetical protein